MIKKFNDFIKESLLDKLKGPSKKDIWKNLGYDEVLDKEEFFLSLIDGIKILHQRKYPTEIFWEKDGEILFEQIENKKLLLVNKKIIWNMFELLYDMNYIEIMNFIKDMIEKYLNWIGLIPRIEDGIDTAHWWCLKTLLKI